ncbi:response regulator [Solibacillus sp. FSL K6-1781]|uniref:response regulator n=1 Tax=Solibacillus sp. FSL K6-1781 TaxID=2921474 RepID=UPI00315B053E
MKILLVEDDFNKIFKIEDFLKKEFNKINITTSNSYNSGLRKILTDKFDLILLDMTMPTFDKTNGSSGGKPIQYAGKEILNQMKRKKNNTPVIVITQYSSFGESNNSKSFNELKEELKAEFSNILLEMIYYESSKSDWEVQVKSTLKNFLND